MTKKDHQAPDASSQSQSDSHIHVETHSQSTAYAGDAAGVANPSSDSNTAATTQAADLTADLQRLQAEFANYKRRAEAERADVIDFAKSRVIRDFLAVRDSFDAEQSHRPANFDPAWAASIDAIRAQFDQVLTGLGVERFDAVGQPFDPHLHEAIATDGTGDTVTEQLQAGYKLGSTILRHAMVKVGSTHS